MIIPQFSAAPPVIPPGRYVHDQGTPSATWTITHNLAAYPSVTAVDTTGRVVIGRVDYLDANTVTVTFNGSTSGKAYIN